MEKFDEDDVNRFHSAINSTEHTKNTTDGWSYNAQVIIRNTIIGIALCLIMTFTLVGNTLVVVAVTTYRQLRTVTNYFVVSLALADLTVAVLVMPCSAIFEVTDDWPFGWIVCYFWISCDVTCCTASILHLVVIAIDRYIAITDPLTYGTRMTSTTAVIIIVAVWMCSSAISFVPIFMGWFTDSLYMTLYSDTARCGLHVNKTYAVVSSTTSFYLPLIVMAIVYAKIFCIARGQSEEIKKLEQSICLKLENRRSRKQTNRDSKAIRTLGTLMGLFCISWLPFFIVYIIKPFCPSCFLPHWLDSIITWLGYCNSFINPCIYGYLNRDFQMAYKSLLCCEKKADKTIRRNHLQMAATSPTEELQRTPLQEQHNCNELNVDTRILAETMIDINIYHGL